MAKHQNLILSRSVAGVFSCVMGMTACSPSSERTPASETGAHSAAATGELPTVVTASSCFGRLPKSYRTFQDTLKRLRAEVVAKTISPEQAQVLATAAANKNGLDPKTMASVYALDMLEQSQSQETAYFRAIEKLAGGAELDAMEKGRIVTVARISDPSFGVDRLPALHETLAQAYQTLRDRGAVMNDKGLDLGKVDFSGIDRDESLKKAMFQLYPDLEGQLGVRQISRAPVALTVGGQMILPHGRVVSADRYIQEVDQWVEIFDQALAEYSAGMREASTFQDWIRGRLVDGGSVWDPPFSPSKWERRGDDDPTAAEIKRDGAYKRLMQALEILNKKYALEPSLLR